MKYPQVVIEQEVLRNGLKVIVAPEAVAPVVTVGVYYKIGFRLEPKGRSGFAHLFEHMMFQGSANVPKMQHVRLINACGGRPNGGTSYDLTSYYQALPSNALERALWLEADRMRALKVDNENLQNQRNVVKEEVRDSVLNQPYGGFPWLDLPAIAFRNWANAHNFYGDFADLDAATSTDVQNFFKTYYVPNNAALLVLGDAKPEDVISLAEKYFGDIPAGTAPPFPDVSEPEQLEERRGYVNEEYGTLPAIALGYLMPKRLTSDWFAMALLNQALHGGRAGRIYQELVSEKQVAVEAVGGVGDILGYNGPTQLVTSIKHKPQYLSEEVLRVFDAVIRQAQDSVMTSDELNQVKVSWKSYYYLLLQDGGPCLPKGGLMHLLACLALFDNNPSLVNTLLEGFLDVTREQILSVARKYLQIEKRAVVFRTPSKMQCV